MLLDCDFFWHSGINRKKSPPIEYVTLQKRHRWGARVAQLTERPTLDFGDGHDLLLC